MEYHPNKVLVKYHVPGIGPCSVELFDIAADLHSFLDRNEEIARLKKLDHLGIIRNVHEGAHHPRWEQIMLHMHLVECARKIKELRFTSNVKLKLDNGLESDVTKKELLKAWALLLNIGHMHWTFEAECAFFSLVKKDSKIRKNLLSKITDYEIKRFCESIIRSETIYKFHYILGFYKLFKWKASGLPTRSTLNINFYIELMKQFCMPSTNELSRLVDSYKAIRNVAFITLDAFYVGSVVEIDLRDILMQPDLLRPLIDQESNTARNLMADISTYLYNTVYRSRLVATKANYVIRNCEWVFKEKYKEGFNSLMGQCFSDHHVLRIEKRQEKESILFCRFAYRVDFPFASILLRPCQLIKEKNSWQAVLNKKKVEVLVWPMQDGFQKQVDIFIRPEYQNNDEEKIKILYRSIEKLSDEYVQGIKNLGLPPRFSQEIYSEIFKEIVSVLFKILFKNITRIEFRRVIKTDLPDIVLISSKAESRKLLNREIKALVGRRYDSRVDELQAMREALSSERARKSLMVISNIIAYNDKGETIGEIDGFYLSLHYEKLRIVIVEAKNTSKPTEAVIRRQLDELIKTRLNLKDHFMVTLKWSPSNKRNPDFGKATLEFCKRTKNVSTEGQTVGKINVTVA